MDLKNSDRMDKEVSVVLNQDQQDEMKYSILIERKELT
jgi:hypothetical protein